MIEYRQGKFNVVADALSRRSDLQAGEGHSINITNDQELGSIGESEINVSNELVQQIKNAYNNDVKCKEVINNPRQYHNHFTIRDGIIYCNQQIYVPDQAAIKMKLLQEAHDIPISGHVGIAKTIDLLTRNYYWPKIHQDVQDYVGSCLTCQSNKARNSQLIGLAQPIPHPPRRWNQVTMDLITQLPRTKEGNDAIVVIVDKYSKMIHCIATQTTVTAPQLAKLFFNEIVKHHGLPSSIISDRDPRFTSSFWQQLWKQLGTKLAMSTAYHPQTDGQTERANRTIEEMLRAYINTKQNDWDDYLAAIEIAYNNSKQTSTGFSPFFLNYGQHPTLPITTAISTDWDNNNNASAEQMLIQLFSDLKLADINVKRAQERQSHYTNLTRQGVEYKVGDKVLLSTTDLRLKMKVTPKLTARYIGPFTIKRKLSPLNYELDLSSSFSIHPVFHIKKVIKE